MTPSVDDDLIYINIGMDQSHGPIPIANTYLHNADVNQ